MTRADPGAGDAGHTAFAQRVTALSRPTAYPGGSGPVECIQTHISAVFLVGNLAYKLKKPKDLGFLDFTTLEARRHFCHEEVRLNRRLAPNVYQGVVPVVRHSQGVRVLERTVEREDTVDAEVVDWAVRMVRLPESRTLRALLRSGEVDAETIERVARRVVDFHARAEHGPEISRIGGWETVRANHRQNFEQIRAFVGETLSEPVFRRLEAVSERELSLRREAIVERARANVPRDTHGDLRLEHVYLLQPGAPGRSPSAADGPDDEVVIVDCVEFNERYRWADPVSDMAFLVMELEFHGRPDLGATFADRYFEAAGDRSGRALLPLYATYRDVVRGKVRSLQASDPELTERRRRAARTQATHHFLAGLGRLSLPAERPGLVVVFGLPGVGKSTVARALTEIAGFEWIDTDRVRKGLARGDSEGHVAGIDGPRTTSHAAFDEGLYTPEWSERTYAACLERARRVLRDGGRVVMEGSFRRDHHRSAFREMAASLGVPVVFLECSVGEDEARRRLAHRSAGPSDADWAVHRRMAASWEPVSESVAPVVRRLPLDGTEEDAVEAALDALAEEGLGAAAARD